jgi:hypothetical protein
MIIVKRTTFVLALTLLPLLLIRQGIRSDYDSVLAHSNVSKIERAADVVTASPAITIAAYPIFAYSGQPVTITVAWNNIPTDGQYKLRVQLENKLLHPDVYYVWQDLTGYSATETRTLTLTIPSSIPGQPTAFPRYGARFVVAFISSTCDWCATLSMATSPRDVTVEAQTSSGWINGQFHAAAPDAGAYLDPDNQPFYARGMVYAYENVGPGYCEQTRATYVISDLIRIKDLGFNTVNLYTPSGANRADSVQQEDCLPEILSWADLNQMAVFVRVNYQNQPDFPDYLDPQYRAQAKQSLDAITTLARLHPSLLAIDLDQRWLLDVDWSGERRYGLPHFMTETLAHLPTWLQDRYGTMTALNTAWNKNYLTFAEVLSDTEIVRAGQVVDLNLRPWRVDLIQYALQVMDDFVAEVIAYARSRDPNHLYTYTNDRAEVIPFPISTQASSGIDQISPAHYNISTDFYRDWIAQAKLTQETLWQRDLYGMPTFVRESGWRTGTLSQTPPNTGYAWSLSDTHKAELYLRQATLMAVYPWIPGWAYFKLYDKPEEGDFGVLSDDGSLRPIAELGRCINENLPVNLAGQQPPQRWVFYPRYALAAPYPAYEQAKTLVDVLEHDFLRAYEDRVTETWSHVTWPIGNCTAITNTRLFTDLTRVFAEHWQPFAFTSTVPLDNQPILLAGRALEVLSTADRTALSQKRTVSFGPIGLSDERFHTLTPWYAQAADVILPPSDRMIVTPTWPITQPAIGILSYPITAYAGRSIEAGIAWRNLPANASDNYKLIVQIENWDISPGVFYQSVFTNFGSTGALTMTLDIDPNQALTSTQPITRARYVAAFISRQCDWCDTLAADFSPMQAIIQPRRWLTVTTPSGLICPVWTGWTAQPFTGTYHTPATFQGGELDGQPAIVQSADGQHTAFLYDALTWPQVTTASIPSQIEASLACHSQFMPPVTPTPLTPADATLTRTSQLTLTWSDVSATGYRLSLNGVTFTTTTPYSTVILADGTFTWTVQSFNALGEYSAFSTPRIFTIDRQAPQLTARTPTPDARGVSLNAAIGITFSEPIITSTFNYAVTPDPGGWSARWNIARQVVTLYHTSFTSGTTYTVTVQQAKDLAGNSLGDAPYAWSFKAADMVYLPVLFRN